jgi:hypothetical protein
MDGDRSRDERGNPGRVNDIVARPGQGTAEFRARHFLAPSVGGQHALAARVHKLQVEHQRARSDPGRAGGRWIGEYWISQGKGAEHTGGAQDTKCLRASYSGISSHQNQLY